MITVGRRGLVVVGAVAAALGVLLWGQRTEIEVLSEQLEPEEEGRVVPESVADVEGGVRKLPVVEVLAKGRRGGMGFAETAEMLEALRGRSTEELYEVLNEVEAAYLESRSEPLHFLGAMLVMAICEADPELALQRAVGEGELDDDLRERAFEVIARRDTGRAVEVLEQIEWSDAGRIRATKNLAAALVREDVGEALAFFRERREDPLHWALLEGALAGAAGDVGRREALWRAVGSEEDEGTRVELEKRLLRSAVYAGGLGAMVEDLERVESVDDAFKKKWLASYSVAAMEKRPDEAYALIRETLGSEEVGQTLAKGIERWAKRDFNAAGEWLGTLEKSVETDAAVGAFARAVAGFDPQAALRWVDEIVEEGERERVRATVQDRQRGE